MQTNARPVRVLVVHRDPLIRAGLKATIDRCPDLEVADDALDEEPWPVDVVVADYPRGVAIARKISASTQAGGRPGVLIVTGIDRESEIRYALDCGVQGYLLLGCELDEVAASVRSVHARVRHPGANVRGRLQASGRSALSARETQIMQLVAEGLPNKLISRRLSIEVGTVKAHLTSAFGKLGVQSRTQAMIAAARQGMLDGASLREHAGGSFA